MNTVVVPQISLDTPEEAKLDESFWEIGKEPRFNATHRCDKCGAQAYVEATFESGSLIFCAHHGKAFRPAMESAGILLKWYSESARMDENRKQGSEN